MNPVATSQIHVLSSTPEELRILAVENGQAGYRGDQLFSWIHKHKVTDTAGMKNLPVDFRARIDALGKICPVEPGEILRSQDGTRKIQVVLADGLAVETVLIPEGDRLTQCISSQVGCAVGCAFCRSGKEGLIRNLSAAEILGQIFIAIPHYFDPEVLRNVVLMGVGEPLHNIAPVLRALALMSHPDGLGLSSRRVTLSTVGIVRGIERLAAATGGRTALAISLHAADEDVRKRLVPGAGSSLSDIVAALKRYPLPDRMRFTIEYVMVNGVNDRDQDARQLVRLLSTLRVKINLLPLNTHDLTDLEPPDDARVEAFRDILVAKGMSAFIRKRRGEDINAACGQLLATK